MQAVGVSTHLSQTGCEMPSGSWPHHHSLDRGFISVPRVCVRHQIVYQRDPRSQGTGQTESARAEKVLRVQCLGSSTMCVRCQRWHHQMINATQEASIESEKSCVGCWNRLKKAANWSCFGLRSCAPGWEQRG